MVALVDDMANLKHATVCFGTVTNFSGCKLNPKCPNGSHDIFMIYVSLTDTSHPHNPQSYVLCSVDVKMLPYLILWKFI